MNSHKYTREHLIYELQEHATPASLPLQKIASQKMMMSQIYHSEITSVKQAAHIAENCNIQQTFCTQM